MGKEKYLEEMRKVANNCPYYQLLGMEIMEIKEGESKLQMPFKHGLTHPYGIMHGGAVASLADSSVAIALMSLVEPKDRIATIEFKINFLVPVSQGHLEAHAKIIHKGSKTAVGDVEVKNEKGKLVARVMATYSIRKGDQD